MHRPASIILFICFLALGTGAIEYLHNLAHAQEDALEDRLAKASGKPSQEHHHDESNCALHAQLHMPALTTAWVPLLTCLGLWVSFLTLLAPALIPRQLPSRIDCRGPPRIAVG